MTPPSSIMGQIVVAGVYRQRGPQGGLLAPVENTKLMAELIESPESPELKLWQVVDRHRPESWKAVSFESLAPLARLSDGNLPAYQTTVRLASGVHQITFETKSKQLLELRTIADWVVRPRLLKVNGVAEVFMQGGDRKQYQVLLDPTALLEYDVTVQDVERALRDSNINTSGGFAITGESERPIRILGRLGVGGQSVIANY